MTAAEKLGYRTDRRPVKMWDIPIPSGDAGIAVTTAIMRMAAQRGAKDPQIRELALNIVQGVGNNDHAGEIDAIYQWVKSNVAFRGEDDETVQAPEVTLRFEAADCDCASTLMAALLGSIGYSTDFKTVAGEGEKDYGHVYAVVWDDSTGQWRPLPLDTTVGEAEPGWEPSGVSRAHTWPGVTGVNGTMRGWRRYGLGDDSQSPADQISEVIDAATPIVQTAITRARGSYPGYLPVQGQGQGQEQYGVSFSSINLPLTQRVWFWPAMILLGGLAIYSFGHGGHHDR